MNSNVMKNELRQRITYIDAVKGLAIIFIVIQHAITNHTDIRQVDQFYLLRFITQMAMPTFFFVNGFLYSKKYSERPIWGIVRKVKAYYVPFVCYNLFFLICNNLFVKLYLQNRIYGDGWYTAKDYLRHFFLILTGHRELMGGAMWFLRTLLVLSVIFILVDFFALEICKGKYRYIILGVMTFIITSLVCVGFMPEQLTSLRLEGILFFFFGFLSRELGWVDKWQKHKGWLLPLSLLICIAGAVLFSVGIEQRTIAEEILYYLFGCIGIVLMILCAGIKIVEQNKILCCVGSYSLEIMCLHFLAYKVVSLIIVFVKNFNIVRLAEYPVVLYVGGAWWIAYTIVGVGLPCIYAYVFKKMKGKIQRIGK